MAFPAFPTDRFHKFISVLGLVIAVWAFESQITLSRERADRAAALTVETVGLIEDLRALQGRMVAAESLHKRDLLPSYEEVAQLRRRGSMLLAKGDATLPDNTLIFATQFGLLLCGLALAFLGLWAWYAAEHPPRPPTIIEP